MTVTVLMYPLSTYAPQNPPCHRSMSSRFGKEKTMISVGSLRMANGDSGPGGQPNETTSPGDPKGRVLTARARRWAKEASKWSTPVRTNL